MAYFPLQIIEHPDFNLRQEILDAVWDLGSDNSGYGQPYSDLVNQGDIINHDVWATMVSIITAIANHQVPDEKVNLLISPDTDDLVTVIAYLDEVLQIITTNRLNAQFQGNTIDYTSVSTSSWSQHLTFTWTIAFSSHDAARHFFNAGGQIGIKGNHPWGGGYTINQQINDLCRDAGLIWLSSAVDQEIAYLAGIPYRGVVKIDLNPEDVDGTTIVNEDKGFYKLSSSDTRLSQQYSSFTYNAFWGGSYAGSFVAIDAAYDNAGTLTIKYIIDEVPNGASVGSGTNSTLYVRYPSNTFLPVSSWGTPNVSSSISAS